MKKGKNKIRKIWKDYKMIYLMIIQMPCAIQVALFLNEIRKKAVKRVVQTVITFPHFMGRYGRNPYRTVWIIWSNQRKPHFDRTAVGITDLQSIYILGIYLGI